jgi:DNA-binding Xre family transcriptional regulator
MKLNTSTILLLMAEKGLTKSELAASSGITRQQLSTIMGRGSCMPRTAGKIAAGLGVPVNKIAREDN